MRIASGWFVATDTAVAITQAFERMTMIEADSGDFAATLQAADTACYAAKEQRRNRIQLYRPDDDQRRHWPITPYRPSGSVSN